MDTRIRAALRRLGIGVGERPEVGDDNVGVQDAEVEVSSGDTRILDAITAASEEYICAQDKVECNPLFISDRIEAKIDGIKESYKAFCADFLQQLPASIRLRLVDVPNLSECLSTESPHYRRIKSARARQRWRNATSLALDRVMRSLTEYHNEQDPASPENTSHIKGRFHRAAQKFKPPTGAEIRAGMRDKNTSDHPYAASARHLVVTRIRKLCADTGMRQYDPNGSNYKRDEGVPAGRPIHTLKDLGHDPTCEEPDPSIVDVYTLIDCVCYESEDLNRYSGSHIALVAPFYPELSGSGIDSIYYADSETTFVEIVGAGTNGVNDCAGARYHNQTSWEFNTNDLTYIESEDRSRYTTYQVLSYPMPEILKQVVFLVALETVHIPYAIMDLATLYTKDHHLSSTGIRPIGPCKNVELYKSDPKVPWTKDILVMSGGSPNHPRLSLKYRTDIGPDSSVVVTNELFNMFHYIQHSGKRGQTLREIQDSLRYNMGSDYGEHVSMVKSAVLAEFLKVSLDYGFTDLPNVVYYNATPTVAPAITATVPDTPESTITMLKTLPHLQAHQPGGAPAPQLSRAPSTASSSSASSATGSNSSVAPPPTEHGAARAVLAGPKLTNGTNPGVFVNDDATAAAYKAERMDAYCNNVEPPPAHKQLSKFILLHFIKCIEQESGVKPRSVHMPSFREIEDARTKPLQKARADTYGRNGEVKPAPARVEIKNEVGHKSVSPRGIACLEYKLGIESGRLGKLLKGIVENCHWFNPGDNPQQIADSIRLCATLGADAARYSPDVTSGGHAADYCKMDETHSEFTNSIVRAVIEYFAADSCRDAALATYDNLFNMAATLRKQKLNTGWKNSSGSGITTELNTIVSAFREMVTTSIAMVLPFAAEGIAEKLSLEHPLSATAFKTAMIAAQNKAYKHLVLQQDEGKLLWMAYRYIGPKFGDDALDPATPLVTDAMWLKCSRYLTLCDGMKTDVEFISTRPDNMQPWEYLSRMYPSPMTSGTSYCKIEKALDKLSIAINSDPERYALKCQGYWTVDSKTPVVNAYLKAMARIYNFELEPLATDENTLDELYYADRDLYYKVKAGPYPTDDQTEELLIEAAARQLGFAAGTELQQFVDGLSQATTREEMAEFKLPLIQGAAFKVDPLHTTRVAAASGQAWLDTTPRDPKPNARKSRSKRKLAKTGRQ
jgi:hypothetical protein